MANYKSILLAIDFSEFSAQTVARAALLAEKFGSQLAILHVVEPLPVTDPSYGAIFPLDFDLTGQMLESASERLEKIAENLAIPKDLQWIEVGNPKAEIVRVANEKAIDLIVIGTHGRHGIGLLLGSTASSVIHHAACDVLTVRLADA